MKTQGRKFAVMRVVILLAGAVWIWISRAPPERTSLDAPSVPFPGFLAPDFSTRNMQGEQVKLADLRGQPVVLNFWASWCAPCRAEMPTLQRLHEEYQDAGLQILAMNSTSSDSLPQVENFIAEHDLDLTALLDSDGTIAKLYQVSALPTTFFIDAGGAIQSVEVGGPLSEALLRVRIENLLKNVKKP